MPEPTPEAWAQIRHAYEHTDQPLAYICADHDITIPMMRYRMKRWDWTRRKPLIPRQGPPPVTVMQPESAALTPLPACGERSAAGAERGWPGEGAPPHAEPVENPRHPISSPCSEIDPGSSPGQALSPPAGRGNEAGIVPQLQSAVARLLPAIEATVARLASGTLNATDLEKAGRTLATLTRTLRELNVLLVQHNAPLAPDDDPVPKDMDEFRYELARRIRGFIDARKNEHGAQPDQAAGPDAAVDGPARA